jgi:hypothetical protein
MSSSSSRNTTSRNTAPKPKPFCVVCRDAGKSEEEYTSHFVKDQPGPNGKVVCPTLLNQACRICHNTGHTSSYCPEYRGRRGERERDTRREDRYIERERERDTRREDREHREHCDTRRNTSYTALQADTERLDREINERNDIYRREQERQSKPWLQAALRRKPYAHPHGPRVRLNLENNALSAAKHAAPVVAPVVAPVAPAIDIRKVNLHHAEKWGDEDNETPFVCEPEKMFREFAQTMIDNTRTTAAEHNFIAECDDQSKMPFCCE